MVHRVLSLDGGGAWALLQAMALRDIYGDVAGRQILANFDIAAGNSGGSIVLGGLVEDKKPSEIMQLFSEQTNRESIFCRLSDFENLLAHIPIFPKYSAAKKLVGLSTLFGSVGDKPLSSFSGAGWAKSPNGDDVKVLIVAMDYDAMRAQFFRNYGTSHGATADTISLVQAVHASSDAPVEFFDKPTQNNGHQYWDGAMAGLNNPLMAAILDLMSNGISAKDIVCLSLGTGTVKLVPPEAVPAASPELSQQLAKSTVLGDLGKAAGCITDDPPDMATFAAHVVLASARGQDPTKVGPVVRLSPVVRPVLKGQAWTVPDHLQMAQFQALTQLGMDAVEQSGIDLIAALGSSWMSDGAPNQPIRMSSSDLASSVGEELYSQAVLRWRTL